MSATILLYKQGHREFPFGNPRECVFRKIPAFNYLYTIILSFDKCSYSARHNVKVHYNFVDYFLIILLIRLELWKSLSRDFNAHKSDLDGFTNVFLPPILFRRRADWWFCTELNRALWSTLEWQTCIVALYGRPTNTACLTCIECTCFFCWWWS